MILDDIIALATDDTASLAVVLRKCLVLAHVLKNDRLKSWAQSELNGYEPDAELPDYRKSAAGAKGNFMGGFGAALNNFVIPPQLLDEGDRRYGQYVLLNQAVASYEDLLDLPAANGYAHAALVKLNDRVLHESSSHERQFTARRRMAGNTPISHYPVARYR